jgi:hypothetical protein
MRTKTLVLTAVVGAISIASAAAQTVYSVNAVGYVNKTIPANSFALLANPLNLPTNTLATVLPDVPASTKLYKFDGVNFTIFTMRPTGWTPNPATSLNPGEGFFIQNVSLTAPMTVTFVGEVLQGAQTVSFGAGFSLLGSKIPQAGKIQTDLGLPAKNGDKIYTYDGKTYAITTRRTDANPYAAGEPVLDVGQGFFFLPLAAGSWSRTFNIPQ